MAGLEEIRQRVIGMGTAARVLEPESLKELVKAELSGALSYYTESVESLQEQTAPYTTASLQPRAFVTLLIVENLGLPPSARDL